MLRAGLPLLLLVFSLAAFAQNPSEDLFQKGLHAYQNRNYEEARTVFSQILEQGPVTARLLHNLALTHYQMNQKAYALAFWRKALALDPSYRAARTGRDLLEGRFNMHPFERTSAAVNLRHTLEYLSFYEVLWLLALAIALNGWLWLRYISERRAALDEERALPPLPTTAIGAAVLFVICAGLTYLHGTYEFSPRATVVAEKASARSLPAEDGVSLFEVDGGSEVLVRRLEEGWTQVQNRDGSTGWLKNSEILVTSGR